MVPTDNVNIVIQSNILFYQSKKNIFVRGILIKLIILNISLIKITKLYYIIQYALTINLFVSIYNLFLVMQILLILLEYV